MTIESLPTFSELLHAAFQQNGVTGKEIITPEQWQKIIDQMAAEYQYITPSDEDFIFPLNEDPSDED